MTNAVPENSPIQQDADPKPGHRPFTSEEQAQITTALGAAPPKWNVKVDENGACLTRANDPLGSPLFVLFSGPEKFSAVTRLQDGTAATNDFPSLGEALTCLLAASWFHAGREYQSWLTAYGMADETLGETGETGEA